MTGDSKIFFKKFDNEFKDKFETEGITYEHRLIDDMVAAAMKWNGGFVWACKNYDGDVQSDTVAQGFGSLGLMTSTLVTPDGEIMEAEADMEPLPSLQTTPNGQRNLNKPHSFNFCMDKRIGTQRKTGQQPTADRLLSVLEAVCIETIESGKMTKDLALLIHKENLNDSHYLTTQNFSMP